jgi:hypothetical protein
MLLSVTNSVVFRDVLAGDEVHVHIFCYDLLANSITDHNSVCELMDCSAMVFVEEFSIF